ncbi:MAG TPA: TrmH family RNA methyltransferase [Bacteroidales bacterium]|nr:TrmH family RNA methyltransferase [Bacteroidales bacterium]
MNLYLKSNDLFAGAEWDSFFLQYGRPVVVADNLRNPENMGALIRLADNAGASEVILLSDNKPVNLQRMKRVAASSCHNIPWQFVSPGAWLDQLPANTNLIAIETTSASKDIFETALPDHPVFVVGNEVNGISQAVLDRASVFVHIPVPGPTRSLNVTHAAAIAMFEWIRQMRLKTTP